MASNDQLIMTMDQQQPWQFRTDAWFADLYSKETETLAKALQQTYSPAIVPSFQPNNDDVFASDLVDSLFAQPEMSTPVHTPTISSENEVPFPKRKSMAATGRIAKRKSRASKRATTTFITADPANFRQMVQQVTGVRFTGDVMQQPIQSVLRPEPQRSIGGAAGFDSSSFLLNSNSYMMNGAGGSNQLATADGGAATASGFGYDGFCSFPTLESWKV